MDSDLSTIKSFGNDFPSHYSIPRRTLGKTSEKLSVIGFGGIMLNDNSQKFANEMVAKAFELGVNYFDVAPKYGNAEEKMGPALKPYRKNCFLACKTRQRGKNGARKDIEKSLQKLETNYFDLYQLHELETIEEVQQAFGPKGALETIVKAKQEGKIKHIGFSAHSVEAALLAMNNFEFDSILFPINFACWNAGNFGPQVYVEAEKRGMGILALKSMALTHLKNEDDLIFKNCWYKPIDDEKIMKMALKYTLSKNVTAAIPPGEYTLFLKALEFLKDFGSITKDETQQLLSLAKTTKP